MPTISNYFCVECCRFMVPSVNGVIVEEKMPGGKPYKLWMADLIKCPKCGKQIISGFGHNPLAEHFEPDYNQKKKDAKTFSIFFEEKISCQPLKIGVIMK